MPGLLLGLDCKPCTSRIYDLLSHNTLDIVYGSDRKVFMKQYEPSDELKKLLEKFLKGGK
jgi:hypothetical protein